MNFFHLFPLVWVYHVRMSDITSVPTPPADAPQSNPKPKRRRTKKRTMSAEKRKALSEATKARWAVKKGMTPYTVQGYIAPNPAQAIAPQPPIPLPPSPAVLSLQSQVVELVNQRSAARQRLTAAHAEYLMAQSKFQAAQGELQGIEQEVQYRIGLIAQMENRQPMAPVLQMPSPVSIAGVSSEPTMQQPQAYPGANDMVNRGHASRDPNALTGSMM
jgi:hypothetical protein